MRGHRRRHRTRRTLSRLCAAGAVACLVLAVVPSGAGSAAAQEDGNRPEVFRSSASTLVAQAFLDREALLPVPDAFRFIALEGQGTYETSNQTARASVLYPGNGLISGPNLLCGTFGGSFPPEFAPILDACLSYEYPLTVFADSLDPDGASIGDLALGSPNDPLSGQAVRAVAHAGPDASRTDASIADLEATGLPGLGLDQLPLLDSLDLDAGIVAIDSASSRTDQRIDADGNLVAEAESVLGGVTLLGGLVEIGSMTAKARIVENGEGGTSQSAVLEFSGMTVAGIEARIDEDGLVLGTPTGLLKPLADALLDLVSEILGGLNLEIRTLEVERGVDEDGLSFARVGGILIEFGIDVDGLPNVPGPLGDIDPNGIYQGSILLGQAGVRGIARHIDTPAFVPVPPTSTTTAAPPVQPDPPPGPDTGAATPQTPDRTPQAAAPGSGSTQLVVSVLDELWAGRLRLVYLAFTLMTLAVCLAPRFALPARFPGARS